MVDIGRASAFPLNLNLALVEINVSQRMVKMVI